ncbi:MAG TPA: hypothetical protein VM120_26090 [Bryobacteraceae bacterium]|nr:hypothetical protein [Bryobacteraceae bacterium]
MKTQTPEKLTKRLRREAALPPQKSNVRNVITQRELEAVLLLERCQDANFSGWVKRYFAGASVELAEFQFDPGNLEDIRKYVGGCSGLNCLSAPVNRGEPAAEPSGADAPAGEPENDTKTPGDYSWNDDQSREDPGR